MRKALVFLLACALLGSFVALPVTGVSASGGFTQVEGAAYIYNDIPASVGTNVVFFCDGTYAGQSAVTSQGVLDITNVGSADGTACQEGDIVTAQVGPFKAMIQPSLHWSNDTVVHQITVRAVETEATMNIGSDHQIINLNLAFTLPLGLTYKNSLGEMSTLYFMSSGSGFGLNTDYFNLNYRGMPFLKVNYDKSVCSGIDLNYKKSSQTSIVSVVNNTGEIMQVMLTLAGTTNPAGLLNPGGSFSVQSDTPGAVQLLKDSVSGSQCLNANWNLKIQKVFLPLVVK